MKGPSAKFDGDKKAFIAAIHDALYCSKICAYSQGFQLMREAQKEYNWTLHFGEIASIWRGGCIIRARFLQKITEEAFETDPQLANLLLARLRISRAKSQSSAVELARGDRRGGAVRSAGADVQFGAVVLRRLPVGAAATRFAAGAAGFLRSAYV